jgi:hypothetical protein
MPRHDWSIKTLDELDMNDPKEKVKRAFMEHEEDWKNRVNLPKKPSRLHRFFHGESASDLIVEWMKSY